MPKYYDDDPNNHDHNHHHHHHHHQTTVINFYNMPSNKTKQSYESLNKTKQSYESLNILEKAKVLDDLYVEWKDYIGTRVINRGNKSRPFFKSYYTSKKLSEKYPGLGHRVFRLAMNVRLSNEKEKGVLYGHKDSDAVLVKKDKELNVTQELSPSSTKTNLSSDDDTPVDNNMRSCDHDVINNEDSDDDSAEDDDTPADNNMRGCDQHDVSNDSCSDFVAAADYDSASENIADDDTAAFDHADHHHHDDGADYQPAADDDTEVVSPGLPKKHLSSREHGLWSVNKQIFERWHTKTKRVNQLLKTWDKQKPVTVGDKVLLPFGDLLQHQKTFWSFDITTLDGFESLIKKRVDNGSVAVRKVFLHNCMQKRKSDKNTRNGFEYIEGGMINEDNFEYPEEYVYDNPKDGSVLVLHWLVQPKVGKVEYNYALMSSINYTDEAIIKDAERETEKRCTKKRPCGPSFNRSGYATGAGEIHDGEENHHNPDAWKGPQCLVDRDIHVPGDENILQPRLTYRKRDGTMKKNMQYYGDNAGYKMSTTDVQNALFKDPDRCLQIVDQMEARFINMLLITGMDLPAKVQGTNNKVPTTLGAGHEKALWSQFNDAMYDYQDRYDTYIEKLPMLTDWQIFMVIYYLQNGVLVNHEPTLVHCDTSKDEIVEQQEMVALVNKNKNYGNTASAKAAALSGQTGNTHFPTLSMTLRQRPGRDTVTMRLSDTPHAGCSTRGETNVSVINHSRKKEAQSIASRTSSRAQLQHQMRNRNQQQQQQQEGRQGTSRRRSRRRNTINNNNS
jgi:hypothetical protein